MTAAFALTYTDFDEATPAAHPGWTRRLRQGEHAPSQMLHLAEQVDRAYAYLARMADEGDEADSAAARIMRHRVAALVDHFPLRQALDLIRSEIETNEHHIELAELGRETGAILGDKVAGFDNLPGIDQRLKDDASAWAESIWLAIRQASQPVED